MNNNGNGNWNKRVTELMIQIINQNFRDSQCIEIISLLTKEDRINLSEIRKKTGIRKILALYYLVKIKEILIIEREGQIIMEAEIDEKKLNDAFFGIKNNIRDKLIEIFESFQEICDIVTKDRKQKKKEQRKKEKYSLL